MDIETQDKYLKIIEEDFDGMKKMLDRIHARITPYPVFTQIEFYKPLLHMIVEAFTDAANAENNEFLNNYDGGDKIEIN